MIECPCFKCGERSVMVDVEDCKMECLSCESKFTVAYIQANIAAWSRVLPWLLAHPENTENKETTP